MTLSLILKIMTLTKYVKFIRNIKIKFQLYTILLQLFLI